MRGRSWSPVHSAILAAIGSHDRVNRLTRRASTETVRNETRVLVERASAGDADEAITRDSDVDQETHDMCKATVRAAREAWYA